MGPGAGERWPVDSRVHVQQAGLMPMQHSALAGAAAAPRTWSAGAPQRHGRWAGACCTSRRCLRTWARRSSGSQADVEPSNRGRSSQPPAASEDAAPRGTRRRTSTQALSPEVQAELTAATGMPADLVASISAARTRYALPSDPQVCSSSLHRVSASLCTAHGGASSPKSASSHLSSSSALCAPCPALSPGACNPGAAAGRHAWAGRGL